MLIDRLSGFLSPRAYSVILLAALLCTATAKFFHSWRTNMVGDYLGWMLADIAVLAAVEALLTAACYFRPRKWVIRTATLAATLVCCWSVINAGWLIRTGTQVLPWVLLPLIRDPLSALAMVAFNLVRMPAAAAVLLGSWAVVFLLLFFVLASPRQLNYSRQRFIGRNVVSLLIVFAAGAAHAATTMQASSQPASADLWYNCQLAAVTSPLADSGRPGWTDLANATRQIPACDRTQIAMSPDRRHQPYNLIVVVLEGIQYKYTSLYDKKRNLTPYLAALAAEGTEFSNTRSSLTHSTKALFALFSGRFPSAYQDIGEAVPAKKPYAAIASILRQKADYRTAFFLSGKGEFECGPGLVYNLGFEKFLAREDLGSTDAFVGYMGGDEFAMLGPVIEWIKADDNPFFLTFMCSVSHDPYEVPKWYATPARDPVERYRQTISYTDKFIETLDGELKKLNLSDNTILCVISDHGEAFGEHGLYVHERIPFDEALLVPWVIRAPSLVEPGTKVTKPTSSVDLAPTVLALLGFDVGTVGFDGVNALGAIADNRRVYFTSWMQQSPAGFVQEDRKFIYNPTSKMVSLYDLIADPFETAAIELPEKQAKEIAADIINWQKETIFQINQEQTGRNVLFEYWHCTWDKRIAWAKYRKAFPLAGYKR